MEIVVILFLFLCWMWGGSEWRGGYNRGWDDGYAASMDDLNETDENGNSKQD